jgi:hypothetical protein
VLKQRPVWSDIRLNSEHIRTELTLENNISSLINKAFYGLWLSGVKFLNNWPLPTRAGMNCQEIRVE